MSNMNMPVVCLDRLEQILTAEELDIVKRFLKSDNSIRASKPSVKKVRVGRQYDCVDEVQGKAAYVWRHVVFLVSPRRQHQCMPSTDIADLPLSVVSDGYLMTNPKLKALHDLVDKVVDCVDAKEWHGVKRWGQALGQIGRPIERAGGTIVYR